MNTEVPKFNNYLHIRVDRVATIYTEDPDSDLFSLRLFCLISKFLEQYINKITFA